MLYGLPIIEIDIPGCVNLIIELNTSLQLKAQHQLIDTVHCMDLYRYIKDPVEDFFRFDMCIAYDAPLRVRGFEKLDNDINLILETTCHYAPYYHRDRSAFNCDPIRLNKDTVTVLKKMLEIHLGDLVNGL